jgi:hypothetical protein
MNGKLAGQPGTLYGVVAAALVMIVGGFGTWATALGGVIKVAGTEGDGWILIVLGVVALGLTIAHVAGTKARKWPMVTIAVLGVLGAAVAAIDLADINGMMDNPAASIVDAGWGIYACLGGAIVLALSAVATVVLRSRTAAPAAGGSTTPPFLERA